jgi:H/ACA ribonucleoprotein complex non-core subunit NAF1
LDLDNILFTKDKILLGNIDDVFGRVDEPKYSVYKDKYLMGRIGDGVIKVGDLVFYEKNLSRILPQYEINQLKKLRGTDASNKFDEEILHGDEMEFSDDEREEAFKADARVKRQEKKNPNKAGENSQRKEKAEKKVN